MPDAVPAEVPAPNLRRLWTMLGLLLAASFGVLLYFGGEIYQQAPPLPDRVVSNSGELLFTGEDINAGMDVWRSIGGQELG